MLYLLLLGIVSAFAPGGGASLDIIMVESAKDVYWNYLMEILGNTPIPDLTFKGGYLKNNKFAITEKASDVQVVTDVANNGVALSIDSLGAQFHSGTFKYKWEFITVKGHVDVDISKMSVHTTVGLTTQTLPNGEVVPAFTVPKVDVNLPKSGIKIHIHGNAAAQIASAFKSLFMGTIRDQITKQLKDIISKELPPALNKVMAEQEGITEIYKDLMVNWALPAAPTVTAKSLEFQFKGNFFPKNESQFEPSVVPPVLPKHDDKNTDQFQFFFTNYLLESLFYSYLEVDQVHFWTKSSDVPSTSPIQLTTSGLNMFFPGMEDYYGPNLPVDIEYKLEDLENFKCRGADSSMSFDGDLGVKFWVNFPNKTTDMAVDIMLEQLLVNFTGLVINGNQVDLIVREVTLNKIEITSSTFGNVNLSLLTKLLNQGIKLGIPVFNTILQKKPITFPTEFAGLFELDDIKLKYFDGYLEAGTTPKFIPPTEESMWQPMPKFYDFDSFVESETDVVFMLEEESVFIQ